MDNFGEYITNEYALLKQILSYLPLDDLLIARKVCKRWHKCTAHILANAPKVPHVYYTDTLSDETEELDYWKKSRVIPDILLRFSVKEAGLFVGGCAEMPEADGRNVCWKSLMTPTTHEDSPDKDVVGKLDEASGIICPRLLHFQCEGPICISPTESNKSKLCVCSLDSELKGSLKDHLSWQPMLPSSLSSFRILTYATTDGKFCKDCGTSSVLVLPHMAGVQYSLFNCYVLNKRPEINLEQLSGDGPVKCLLLFDSNSSVSSYYKMQKLLATIVGTIEASQGAGTFAFGGGKLEDIHVWSRRDVLNGESYVLGILVRGENVTAHSEIMKNQWTQDAVETYFSEFSKRVGPMPEGAVRIGIMTQCIDRPRILGSFTGTGRDQNKEAAIFAKHFPNVPLCGFLAGGEYGIRSESCAPKPPAAKKLKLRTQGFMHFESTSLVILTFNSSAQKGVCSLKND